MFAKQENDGVGPDKALPRPGRTAIRTRRARCRPAVERLEDRRLLSTGALDVSFSLDGKANVFFDLGGSNDDRAAAGALVGRVARRLRGFPIRVRGGDVQGDGHLGRRPTDCADKVAPR
jgi:hypothetical protein